MRAPFALLAKPICILRNLLIIRPPSLEFSSGFNPPRFREALSSLVDLARRWMIRSRCTYFQSACLSFRRSRSRTEKRRGRGTNAAIREFPRETFLKRTTDFWSGKGNQDRGNLKSMGFFFFLLLFYMAFIIDAGITECLGGASASMECSYCRGNSYVYDRGYSFRITGENVVNYR